MKNFDRYQDLLRAWGFECHVSTRSLDHSALGKYRSAEVKDYQIWTHPLGVLACVKSYMSGGYKDRHGNLVPREKSLGSITLHAQVHSGNGAEVQHRAAVEVRGSGGNQPQLDGGFVRSVSDTFHSNAQGSLYRFFKMIQSPGRPLPIEQWGTEDGFPFVSLPGEVICPVLDGPEGMDVAEILSARDIKAELAATLAKLPLSPSSGTSLFFLPEWTREEEVRDGLKKTRTGPAWDPVEFSLAQFSEAMFLAGKRWAKPQEKRLLAHWNEVVLGRLGEDLDPQAMRAYEAGPAGLSLATALLYSKRNAPHAEQLLCQLLEQAPLDVLTRWATVPDAAGYTLALRAVHRVLSYCESQVERHAAPDVDVLEILHRRLGPEGICLATPRRSFMGLLPQFVLENTASPGLIEQASQIFVGLTERFEDMGVAWADHIRWRNYPNLFMEKERPAFFQVNGPTDPDQWMGVMKGVDPQQLAPVISILQHRSMSQSSEPDRAPLVRSRPRL